jgi:thioredoxin reductase (NADPH)
MSKPTILAVDDDPNVSAAITRDLRGRYATGYRIVRATSGPEALEVLARLALRGQPVALIVADQRMPQMTGIEMLEQARTHAPGAKYLLLTAYADTDVAIKAINDIGLDYYLLKPWDPPEERLFPVIDDLLGDWRQANPDHTSDVQVVGHRWSDRSHDIKMFLARNYVPYRWYDVERDAEAQRLRDLAHATPADLPLVLVPDGDTLRSPSTLELAGALGLRTTARQPLYDVCIVGGGPAGLAAAVYAASEGLSTVIVEREAPGGQAGQSAAIENYLGFPKGLTGSDLAQRAIAQVSRFGAEVVLARDVVGFEARGPVRAVLFAGSGQIEARAHRGDGRVLPAPGSSRSRRAHRPRRLLRRERQRREHSDLRCYLTWCAERALDPLAARRPHLELYIRWMQEISRFKPSVVSRGSRSRPVSTEPASSTACWSTRRPSMSAARLCPPNRRRSDSLTCSLRPC